MVDHGTFIVDHCGRNPESAPFEQSRDRFDIIKNY
jgi:hypothetical protein